MFTQRLQKNGNTYFVTIPEDEVEQRGLHEGQVVTIQVTEIEERRDLADDIRTAIDERWERNEPALRYLADR